MLNAAYAQMKGFSYVHMPRRAHAAVRRCGRVRICGYAHARRGGNHALAFIGGRRSGLAAVAHLRHLYGGHSRRRSRHAPQEHERGRLHVRQQGRGRVALGIRVRSDLFLRRRIRGICGQVRLEFRAFRRVDRHRQHARRHARRMARARKPHQEHDRRAQCAHDAGVFRKEIREQVYQAGRGTYDIRIPAALFRVRLSGYGVHLRGGARHRFRVVHTHSRRSDRGVSLPRRLLRHHRHGLHTRHNHDRRHSRHGLYAAGSASDELGRGARRAVCRPRPHAYPESRHAGGRHFPGQSAVQHRHTGVSDFFRNVGHAAVHTQVLRHKGQGGDKEGRGDLHAVFRRRRLRSVFHGQHDHAFRERSAGRQLRQARAHDAGGESAFRAARTHHSAAVLGVDVHARRAVALVQLHRHGGLL